MHSAYTYTIHVYIYTVSQKRYHPTTNDNFNNSCRIPVILVQILLSKYAIEWWFNVPPHLLLRKL